MLYPVFNSIINIVISKRNDMSIYEIEQHSIQINGLTEHKRLIQKFKKMSKKMRDSFRNMGMFSNYVRLAEELQIINK